MEEKCTIFVITDCCYGGALRANLGPQWSVKVWEASTATEPGYHYRKLYVRHDKLLSNSIRYKSKPSVQQLRWKKIISTQMTSTTRKVHRAYGPEAVKVTDDVSTDDLTKHINLSAKKCANITRNSNSAITVRSLAFWEKIKNCCIKFWIYSQKKSPHSKWYSSGKHHNWRIQTEESRGECKCMCQALWSSNPSYTQIFGCKSRWHSMYFNRWNRSYWNKELVTFKAH